MNKVRKFAFTAALAVAFALTFNACGSDDDGGVGGGGDISSSSGGSGGGISSSGGGISSSGGGDNASCGKLMSQNLNVEATGSMCYNNEPANCTKYGRLYDWATAMNLPGCNSGSCSSQIQEKHQGICPSGYHIPSMEELNEYGSYECLKNQAGGSYSSDGGFRSVDNRGYWWSTDEDSDSNGSSAYYRGMNYNYNEAHESDYDKRYLFSVRCVKD
jgi:hypothetical protein